MMPLRSASVLLTKLCEENDDTALADADEDGDNGGADDPAKVFGHEA